MEAEIGVQYSNPVNDDRYAEKGVRSNREGDKAPAVPRSPLMRKPEDMYVTGKDPHKKQPSRAK